MQQELHRLERMMALVTEALQKKGGDVDDTNKMEDVNQHPGINTGTNLQKWSVRTVLSANQNALC